jgi:hypothetical protein
MRGGDRAVRLDADLRRDLPVPSLGQPDVGVAVEHARVLGLSVPQQVQFQALHNRP